MAICAGDYLLLRDLHRAGKAPQSGCLLEIGEANWYGDVHPEMLEEDFGVQPAKGDLYALARQLYKAVFNYWAIDAIDLFSDRGTLKWDLNEPHDLQMPARVVINSGTHEHVFNQGQVWASCHEWTEPGGLMIHAAPVSGWWNHGFYNVQPTLIADVQRVNEYTLEGLYMTVDEKPSAVGLDALLEMRRPPQGNVMLHWAWRTPAEHRPFEVPQQGYYAKTLSKEAQRAWRWGR